MNKHHRKKTWLLLFTLVGLWSLGPSCSSKQVVNREEEHLRTMRLQMVEQQLRQHGIRDERVLQIMAEVPRHLFVPVPRRGEAYDDRPLPIDEGQTISQP